MTNAEKLLNLATEYAEAKATQKKDPATPTTQRDPKTIAAEYEAALGDLVAEALRGGANAHC